MHVDGHYAKIKLWLSHFLPTTVTRCRPSSPALIASLKDALDAIGAEGKDYGVGLSACPSGYN
jgi:hypothetical protein